MKALILEQNVKERSLIQHVLEKAGMRPFSVGIWNRRGR